MAVYDWARRTAARLTSSPLFRAAVFYTLLTVVLAYPLSLHPASTTFPGSSDRNLYVWTLAWDAHAFLHQPWRIFDANIFHPYSRTLAYSENLIGAAMLIAPLEWVVQDPFLSFNIASLLTVPLCALGAYLLARRLGLGEPAAWICGLVFGFAPPRFLRVDQAHLTAVEWIPFCLAYAHTYASSGRQFDLRMALAFLSLQILTSGHGAVFLLATLAGGALYVVATGGRIHVTKVLRDSGLTGAIVLVPAALMLVPYRMVQIEVGLRRDLGDWTGSWASFLSSPTHVDAFMTNHLGAFGAWINANTQASLFPGLVPLLLVGAAFAKRRTRNASQAPGQWWSRIALLLECAFIGVIGLGIYARVTGTTRVEVGGLTLSVRALWRVWVLAGVLACLRIALLRRVRFSLETRATNVRRFIAGLRGDSRTFYTLVVVACLLLAIGPPYGPWRFVYWLPGLSFIRVPSRFMILGTLGIAVLSAYGFERLVARVSHRSQWLTAAFVGAALIAEFAVVPFDVVASPREIPAADRWLANQPRPFVVAELPPMDPTIPMLHSMAHWQKTIHGYSGWNPARSQSLAAALTSVPDAASLNALSEVGVTYLVVHMSMYPPDEWPVMAARLERASTRLSLRYNDAEGRVYSLAPAVVR